MGISRLIVKHCDEIKAGLSAVWEVVKAFFAQWGDKLIPLLGPFFGVPPMIVKHWEDIKEGLLALWQRIKIWQSSCLTTQRMDSIRYGMALRIFPLASGS
ncbi:hypothetical protein [Paenibacillus ginsengarvi]|uniref:hypothetical protein n=1 Tax=Paenibacillus ginsengarvi TaxID=400777 RepID=UPI0011C39059|nr:hypothetical protein [Paenibacillus ginsengarvi]